TLVADNGGSGMVIQPSGTTAWGVSLNRVEVYHNSVFGVFVSGALIPGTARPGVVNVSVFESVAAHNGRAGFAARSATGHADAVMLVVASMSSHNGGPGFLADTPLAFISVGQSSVMGNNGLAGSGAVASYGDNYSFQNMGGNGFPSANFKL